MSKVKQNNTQYQFIAWTLLRLNLKKLSMGCKLRLFSHSLLAID